MLHWYKHWRRSLREMYSPLSEELPWLTYEAINWLQSYLRPEMRVFEWGSGGSTLFFARRVHSVVTIEHDPEWYTTVKQTLHNANVDNVRVLLHAPVHANDSNSEFCSIMLKDQFKGLSFEPYVRAIDAYPDCHFDLVMVDGRARISCVRRAIDKVCPGGHLLLDNTERKEYLPAVAHVRYWKERKFAGPVFNARSYILQCALWQKPSSE